MGDRVNCTLSLWGRATRAQMNEVYDMIHSIEGTRHEEIVQIVEHDDSYLYFEEMNYGTMPDELKTLLMSHGIGFCWDWDGGYDFCAGRLLVTTEGETWRHSILDDEIVLTLTQIQDGTSLAIAQQAAAAMYEGHKMGMKVADSAHEHFALIAEDQASSCSQPA